MVVLDGNGRIAQFNRACEQATGYSSDEAVGQPFPDFLVLPGEADEVRRQLLKLLEGGGSRRLESHWRTRAGQVRLVDWSSTAIADGVGRPAHVVLSGVDVTGREPAVQAPEAVAAVPPRTTPGRADLDHVMQLVVEWAQQLTRSDAAVLELVEGTELVLRAASGTVSDRPGLRVPLAGTLSGRCVETGTILVWTDTEEGDAEAGPPVRARSTIVAPLLHEHRTVGALKVTAANPHAFGERDVSTMELLAGLVAANMAHGAEIEEKRELLAERTVALGRLAESEARFRKAFDDAPIGMALVGVDPGAPGRLLEVNRSLCRMMGRPEHELLTASLLDLVHPDHRMAEIGALARLSSGGRPYQAERRYVRPDGRQVQASLSASLVADGMGRPRYVIAQLEDITQRKDAEQKLTELALHDPLTGLSNRLLLMDRLQHALARARRRSSLVGLLFCDLDRFKVINDSLGHETGDELLVILAARLEGALRSNDTAARLGGDEFVIVCEDLADEDEAFAIARRVAEVVSEPCRVGGREVVVTTSVGVVLSDGHASPYSLLRDADAAMYRAKDRGRARYEVFDEALAVQARERLNVEHGLRTALELDQLHLHYQPTVDLATGHVVGVEALLRWDHPDRGLVSPGEFLEVAEETGLIVPIGTWALRQACRDAAAWGRRVPDRRIDVSVNLASLQIARADLVELVRTALADAGLDGDQLCLELTESVLIDATPQAVDGLCSLKSLGVRLAIDDFGTGYSSLSYLRRFPVDVVKIDRSFVEGLGSDPEDEAIVSAVLSLATALRLTAVAEGVESECQLARLRALGCPLAQGFLFSRALPVDELAEWLAGQGRGA